MKKHYVIGLDIGTTSTKAVIFNKNGIVIAESESSYSVFHPCPSWVEQDPLQIELAAIHALHDAIASSNIEAEQIISIGISSAMHSIICVDENHQPLSPSITWADGRSVAQGQALKANGGTDIYLKTGTPIHPMSPLIKLLWMKENDYEPYKRARKFISIKEFIMQKWFGEYVVDYSVASASGLFNIRTFTWEEDALCLVGITEEQLSKPVPPTYICQGLDPNVANKIGIHGDIPFAIGASDGPLANLGIGAISPGDVAITVGTSGAIRQMTNAPTTDTLQEIFCYGLTQDLWITGGPTNNGGIVLQWLKDLLGEYDEIIAPKQGVHIYDLLTKRASKIKAGSDGLIFLPYLNGERAPHWDANARGSFIGLTLAHNKDHMIRAGLEGVIFSLYNVGEALERLAGKPNNILASGGFARSELWLQILSDMFGHEIQIPESHQSSAWGAAWFSLYAIGEVESLEAIKDHIPMKKSLIPNSYNHNTYLELYEIYKGLYNSLKPHFQTLANYQRTQ
ncbi:gluconokinase [Bacillus sp. FJAT-45350]|uniref:gluconokinase n=1 Tax=Bacillus sp. FJAT-45350 TaxID=2011014 RepID=UPI000BB6B4E9|nr:gluconokinase [Bacillus sp. FJAT-45350]